MLRGRRVTAPESRAPREGRTGEARPEPANCDDCFHARHEGGKCAKRWSTFRCECATHDPIQPPAPPSVGDATPEAPGLLERVLIAEAEQDGGDATPEAKPLSALAVEILEINRANGWNVLTPEAWGDTYRIPGILALIHSEVSEALEGFRKNDRANVAEELADVLIRVLDMAGGLGIDMDEQVRAKLAKNRTRGYRHGGKKV